MRRIEKLMGEMCEQFWKQWCDSQQSIFIGYRKDALSDIFNTLPMTSFADLAATLNRPEVGCIAQWRATDGAWRFLKLADTGVMHALRSSGAAIMFLEPQAAIKELRVFLEELKSELGFGVETLTQCSIFTSAKGHGIPRHCDDKDVWLVGVSGCKRIWTEPNYSGNVLANFMGAEPMSERASMYDVGVGDVLFIPRGMWHATESLEDDTFSISFAIQRPTLQELMHRSLNTFFATQSRWKIPITSSDARIPRELLDDLAQELQSRSWPLALPRDRNGEERYVVERGVSASYEKGVIVVESEQETVEIEVPPDETFRDVLLWLAGRTQATGMADITTAFTALDEDLARNTLRLLFEAGFLRKVS